MTTAFTIFIKITVYLVYYNWSMIDNNIHCIKFNNPKKKKLDECNCIKWTQQSK